MGCSAQIPTPFFWLPPGYSLGREFYCLFPGAGDFGMGGGSGWSSHMWTLESTLIRDLCSCHKEKNSGVQNLKHWPTNLTHFQTQNVWLDLKIILAGFSDRKFYNPKRQSNENLWFSNLCVWFLFSSVQMTSRISFSSLWHTHTDDQELSDIIQHTSPQSFPRNGLCNTARLVHECVKTSNSVISSLTLACKEKLLEETGRTP